MILTILIHIYYPFSEVFIYIFVEIGLYFRNDLKKKNSHIY